MKQSHETRAILILWFVISILAILSFAFGFCIQDANAQEWDWSPPAPHHEALCKVSVLYSEFDNKKAWVGGSGVFIEHEGLRGVLTVAHIMTGKEIVISWSDGGKSYPAANAYTTDKFGHDLAFVFTITPGFITPISLAKENPAIGDRVELITVGGPKSQQRTFWAEIEDIWQDTMSLDCAVISGDSGGGVLNTSSELIGIQAFGDGYRKILTQTGWNAYQGSGSVSCGRIRDFLGRIVKSKKCGPRGCPLPGDDQFYPPRLQEQAAFRNQAGAAWRPASPGKPVAVTEPARNPKWDVEALSARKRQDPRPPAPSFKLQIDYDKLADVVLAKIDLSKLRGPVGPQGKPGSTGAQGRPGSQGQQGPTGSATTQDIDVIAEAGKKRIGGSIRIKVTPISSSSKSSLKEKRHEY